jgi:replicative DNA helicase
MTQEKLPPRNIEAEEAVIGSCLIDGDMVGECNLQPIDFYSEKLSWIWDAVMNLYRGFGGINEITVGQELARQGKLEKVGGSAYLARLIANVPDPLHAQWYARIVLDASLNRQIIDASGQIARLGYAEGKPKESIDKAIKTLVDIHDKLQSVDIITPRKFLEMADERYARLRKQSGTELHWGISTLDDAILGAFPAEVSYIGARTGMGKSELLLGFADHFAKAQPVLYVSPEMHDSQLQDRLMASKLGVSLRTLRNGNYSDSLYDRIYNALPSLEEREIYWMTAEGMTTQTLYAKAKQLQASVGLGAIIVDYIQLLEDNDGENAVQRISNISRRIKKIARECNVHICCACQLNRQVEGRQDKRPQLSDLRESGALEQDADLVLLLYRDDYYDANCNPNQAQILVAKNRQGTSGYYVECRWNQTLKRYEGA